MNLFQLWDTVATKRLRNMTGHAARVGSLSWNSYILSSGSRSGAIHHHDVRVANHHVGTLMGHTQEVCGLKWSPDGKHLASGGNDNLLNIWSNQTDSMAETQPLYSFTQHQAAVKVNYLLVPCTMLVLFLRWENPSEKAQFGKFNLKLAVWNCCSHCIIITCLLLILTS